MKSNLQGILNLAAKVKTPLSLTGLIIVVLYAIYRQVLSLNVFENVGSNATFLILEDILDKLFWLALVALILGIISYLVTTFLAHKKQEHSSNVVLIDASLDRHDSPYEQTEENGRKVIRYTGNKDEIDVSHQENRHG